jgi:TusA-related sulfurtransferase
VTVARCETGALELGAGLEALVSATLAGLAEGEDLDVVSLSRSAVTEISAWARHSGHDVVGEDVEGGRSFAARLRRGPVAIGADAAAGTPLSLADGRFTTAKLREAVGPVPPRADPGAGMIPLGAVGSGTASRRAWRENDRDALWADKLAQLADRSARAQWDAVTDIPWAAAEGLKPDVERAVAQVMTYVAQNEYAAYYVPARHLAQINPAFLEMLMWLSGHVRDEARHIEVFTKRAVLGGVRSPALESTDLSLQTLLDEHDFTAAALLLNVLGEGTFLDLLAFIARHAPDAATATAAGLAQRDEQRHVQFGIAHVRRRLTRDPEERAALVTAVEERAARLVSLDGLNPVVAESLVLMSARSRQPTDVAEAGAAVRPSSSACMSAACGASGRLASTVRPRGTCRSCILRT